MNLSGPRPVVRLIGTVVLAILCGGFGWNVVGEQLLNASTPVRWALWAVFAAFGATAFWSSKEPMVRLDRRAFTGVAVVLLCAIAAVVLLREPANLYVAAAVLLVGGTLRLRAARRAPSASRNRG